mgnify:CR=1 FL=1
MSKIKRTDKQTPPLGKKTKIFDLAPTGVYGKFKAKDFKGIKHLIKKGHKDGGMMKYSEGSKDTVSAYERAKKIKETYDKAKGPGEGQKMVDALKSPGAKKTKDIMEDNLGMKLYGDETFEEILEIQRIKTLHLNLVYMKIIKLRDLLLKIKKK